MKPYFLSLSLILVLVCGCASMSETGELYRSGLDDVREGKSSFAFLNLKTIVDNEPHSPYAPNSAFAVGEYFFDNKSYSFALKALSDYIHNYPKDKGVVFAKIIIYKIIVELNAGKTINEQENALVQLIRKELFSQPLFLIFYDKKSPRFYKSFFNNSYLVYDYVDKIKVFRNDKIFLELLP